jgi:hypothetical protein
VLNSLPDAYVGAEQKIIISSRIEGACSLIQSQLEYLASGPRHIGFTESGYLDFIYDNEDEYKKALSYGANDFSRYSSYLTNDQSNKLAELKAQGETFSISEYAEENKVIDLYRIDSWIRNNIQGDLVFDVDQEYVLSNMPRVNQEYLNEIIMLEQASGHDEKLKERYMWLYKE